jgi:hypothetical protein
MTDREPSPDESDAPPAMVLGRGRMSQVIVRDAGSVIKRYNGGLPGHVATREATRARIATTLGARTPAILSVHDTDVPPALCLERIDAPTLLQALLLGRIQAADAGRRLAAAHHGLLTLPSRDPRDCSLDGLPCVSHLLPGPRAETPQRNEPAEDRASSREERLRHDGHAWQPSIASSQDRTGTLCHLDFHPGNLLWDPSTDTSWIIDWYDASWGEPAVDVAWTSLLLRFGEVPAQTRLPMATLTRLRHELHATYTHDIVSMAGLERESIAAWIRILAGAWPKRLARDTATQRHLARLAANDTTSCVSALDFPEALA